MGPFRGIHPSTNTKQHIQDHSLSQNEKGLLVLHQFLPYDTILVFCLFYAEFFSCFLLLLKVGGILLTIQFLTTRIFPMMISSDL